MRKTLSVAWWEYIEKVKSKAFIISLFLTPTIMVGVGVIPTILASRADTESKVIGIVDLSGEMTQPLGRRLEDRYKLPNGQPNYILLAIPLGSHGEVHHAKEFADSLVISEMIEGYVIVGPSILNDSLFEYRSENVGNFKISERLASTIREIVFEKKLTARGFDPSIVKNLTSSIEMKSIKLSKSGKEEEAGFEKVFFTSYVFMMMTFILVMTSGQMLVRSMLEEKSNRVVEVLMSSVSANNLMAGKIIGLSALGLTQIGFWALIGVVVSLKFAVTIISVSHGLLLLVYFLVGYLFYAAIFVAAGSPVSTEQEAQQITSYLVIVLMIPIALAFMVIQDPNSTLVKVLTFIPLLTPSMMAMRIPLQMPSTIEIVLTLALLTISAITAIWIAGKIFRTTILSYGKKPSLRELAKLVRAS